MADGQNKYRNLQTKNQATEGTNVTAHPDPDAVLVGLTTTGPFGARIIAQCESEASKFAFIKPPPQPAQEPGATWRTSWQVESLHVNPLVGSVDPSFNTSSAWHSKTKRLVPQERVQQRIDEPTVDIFVAHATRHEREQERNVVHSVDTLRERIAKCRNDPVRPIKEDIATVRQVVAKLSESWKVDMPSCSFC